jgi:ABC-2 type transport system ATP-binding protein
MMDDLLLRTRGLTKRFGSRTAVDGLTVELRRGRLIGLLGPNGSGKSTTIRMLLGLIRPTSGDAEVLGRPVSAPGSYLHRVGALIEEPVYDPALTARRFLECLARAGGHRRDRVAEVLHTVGLADRGVDRVDDFSLGMKQRLGLAAALLPDPDLLVLDEPTNGLDPAGIVEIRDLLRREVDAGRSVIVSSHLLSEMETICDDVVIITGGRLVYSGALQELRDRYPGELRTIEVRPSLEAIFLDLTTQERT